MANRNKKRRKPRRKHFRMNIATIVSVLVLLYMIVRMIMSFMQPKVSTYEVTSQKIYETISTTGIALRNEKLVKTENAGYVTYFVADGERVGVDSTVYALDPSGAIHDKINAEEGLAQLSDQDYLDIKNQIIDYKSTYSDTNFNSVNDFKYALDNHILEITNDSIISQVGQLASSGSSLNQMKSGESGVVSYSYDGLEGVTVDTINKDTFKNSGNEMKQIRSSELYSKDSPVYRLVTDENWNLVVSLSKEQYQRMVDLFTKQAQAKNTTYEKLNKYMKVKFLKDDLNVERPVTLIERDGSYFCSIAFNKYMERYIDERYLDVELILNSADGLKIPNSSLVKEKLYQIPVDYAVESDETISGIAFNAQTYDKKGKLLSSTIAPAVCYKDEKYFYVSSIDVEKGTILIKNVSSDDIKNGQIPDGSDTYTVSAAKEFEGVYTINKGYAQFVVIDNLYQADDFCIAKGDSEFGIAQYDHVVLDSKAIAEGQLIY